MSQLTRILDIWGGDHYARTADLEDHRAPLIPILNQDGTAKRMKQGYKFQEMKIRRSNIKQIG